MPKISLPYLTKRNRLWSARLSVPLAAREALGRSVLS